MTDEAEKGDQVKTSKRERLFGALSRSRTKLKKHDNKAEEEADDFKLSDDVNDFLSAGRTIASSRPSAAGSHNGQPQAQMLSAPVPSPRTQQSPRKLAVPRIDVSSSQRWPGAQAVRSHDTSSDSNLLATEYNIRSRSPSALARRKGRARGLSVAFAEAPPIIIGEGGDEAEAPTAEISRAKQRARSMSPTMDRSGPGLRAPFNPRAQGQELSTSSIRASASPTRTPFSRTPTGFTNQPNARSAIDQDFEMSLKSGYSPIDSANSHASTTASIHTPKPGRPAVPVPVPQIRTPDPDQQRRSVILRHDSDMQAEEGMALRTKHSRDLSNSSAMSYTEAGPGPQRDEAPHPASQVETIPTELTTHAPPPTAPLLKHKPPLQDLSNAAALEEREMDSTQRATTLSSMQKLSLNPIGPDAVDFDDVVRNAQFRSPDSAGAGTPASMRERGSKWNDQRKPTGDWV